MREAAAPCRPVPAILPSSVSWLMGDFPSPNTIGTKGSRPRQGGFFVFQVARCFFHESPAFVPDQPQ